MSAHLAFLDRAYELPSVFAGRQYPVAVLWRLHGPVTVHKVGMAPVHTGQNRRLLLLA